MKKILLVEDDAFLIDIYTTKFKKAGLSLDVAIDGEEGLRKLKEDKPNVLLLDIVLPIIDGWEFLKKAQKINQQKETKIIVLSNLGQEEEVKKGLELGADKYLIKAKCPPSKVVEEVKKMLK